MLVLISLRMSLRHPQEIVSPSILGSIMYLLRPLFTYPSNIYTATNSSVPVLSATTNNPIWFSLFINTTNAPRSNLIPIGTITFDFLSNGSYSAPVYLTDQFTGGATLSGSGTIVLNTITLTTAGQIFTTTNLNAFITNSNNSHLTTSTVSANVNTSTTASFTSNTFNVPAGTNHFVLTLPNIMNAYTPLAGGSATVDYTFNGVPSSFTITDIITAPLFLPS